MIFWLALLAISLVVLGGYLKLCADGATQAELKQAAKNQAWGTAMQCVATLILTLIIALAGGSYGPADSLDRTATSSLSDHRRDGHAWWYRNQYGSQPTN